MHSLSVLPVRKTSNYLSPRTNNAQGLNENDDATLATILVRHHANLLFSTSDYEMASSQVSFDSLEIEFRLSLCDGDGATVNRALY